MQITLGDELYVWLTKEIKDMNFGSYTQYTTEVSY